MCLLTLAVTKALEASANKASITYGSFGAYWNARKRYCPDLPATSVLLRSAHSLPALLRTADMSQLECLGDWAAVSGRVSSTLGTESVLQSLFRDHHKFRHDSIWKIFAEHQARQFRADKQSIVFGPAGLLHVVIDSKGAERSGGDP